MAKFSKIFPRILFTILALILVSSILLSTFFAKYITSNNILSNDGRPAAFEVVFEKEFDNLMSVNFAKDGEPGNPLGHTSVIKDYKFSVVSNYTEVALTYDIIIEFNSVVGKMMYTGKTNPYADGISCYYEVYEVTDKGETKLSGTELLSGNAITKWTYTKPYLAPNPAIQRKSNYILRVIFYNNTDMTANPNGYTFSSDAVTITAKARQIDKKGIIGTSIINGTQADWNMSDGIDRMLKVSTLPQNTQLDLRIPITEAGNYDISFNAGLELTKQGASATLSVPKTVYTYGDKIPISYDIFDASNIKDSTAWIAIASTVYHEERYVKWGYVGGEVKDAVSGTVFDMDLLGAPQEHASSFKDGSGRLLPGSYRIYLLQGDSPSGIYDTNYDKFLSQYILTDPINITILPPDNLDDESKNGKNMVENDFAILSTEKAIYRHEEKIEISYKIKGAHGSDNRSWISMASPVDWTYSRWDYVNDNSEGKIDFKTTYEDPGDGSYFESCYDSDGDLLPGYYRIVLVKDGVGLQSSALLGAETQSLPPASLSILVLPKSESQSSGISTYETTPYGSASMTLNHETNLFYTGSEMTISVATNGVLTGYTTGGPWVARGRLDMNTGYYVYPSKNSSDDLIPLTNGTHIFGGFNTAGNYLLCFCGSTADSPIPMNNKPYYTPAIGVTVVKNHNLIPKVKTDSETFSGDEVNDLYNLYNSEMQSGTVSFTATQKDVENGYVTLSFDFSDFDASTYYNININNFSITKKT